MNISTAETKNHLHKLIAETDDEGILSKVRAYFTLLKNKTRIGGTRFLLRKKKPLTLLENGEGIPHKEVKRKVAILLGRK